MRSSDEHALGQACSVYLVAIGDEQQHRMIRALFEEDTHCAEHWHKVPWCPPAP